MKKSEYAKMFTKRKDGYYQKYVKGKVLYDKDPEKLYHKWRDYVDGRNISTVLFKQAASEWENIHREEISERTWNNYAPHYHKLIAEYGNIPVENITAQDVNNELIKAKARGYSATVVKSIKTVLVQILDHALVEGYIKYNPASSVKLPKALPKSKRSAPTEDDMRTIINSTDEVFGFYAFFLLTTGLRKSEALALTKKDIDWKKRQINITKALEYSSKSKPNIKTPKTEAGNRVVPIIDLLYDKLQLYCKSIPGEILFPSPKSNRNPGGGYMSSKAYDLLWKKYTDATGLNLTAHQFRHGTATLMFEAGVDVYTAQKILGHANISTTMEVYTELRNAQQLKSIEKFNNEMKKYM